MEVWKDIKGFEKQYQISKSGIIKSKRTNKEIKQCINSANYYQVMLYKNKKRYNKLVHRLYAETFIPNPENKQTINHIDGNTLNNSIDNLEWATMQEQQIHRNYILGHKSIITDKCRKKQIENHQRKVRRSDGVIFESIKIASNGDENLRKHICQVCRNQRKTAGGYRWEYVL